MKGKVSRQSLTEFRSCELWGRRDISIFLHDWLLFFLLGVCVCDRLKRKILIRKNEEKDWGWRLWRESISTSTPILLSHILKLRTVVYVLRDVSEWKQNIYTFYWVILLTSPKPDIMKYKEWRENILYMYKIWRICPCYMYWFNSGFLVLVENVNSWERERGKNRK